MSETKKKTKKIRLLLPIKLRKFLLELRKFSSHSEIRVSVSKVGYCQVLVQGVRPQPRYPNNLRNGVHSTFSFINKIFG